MADRNKSLLTVKEVMAKYPLFSLDHFRRMAADRHKNGLDVAVFRVGGKLIIDEDKFVEWLTKNQRKDDTP